MGQLALPRRGWENEHLATYLLSKVAFVANPVTVGDDVGSDFFCTLFDQREENGRPMLYPHLAFAIQVKSSIKPVNATRQIEYFAELDLPYLLGVVNQEEASLAIYSGEFIPIFYSERERPVGLTLKPVLYVEDPGRPENRYRDRGESKFTLFMPFIAKISASDSGADLAGSIASLKVTCTRIQRNIASKRAHEYVFLLGEDGSAVIMAGPTSAEHFRSNFALRLAEVFYNLEWLLRNRQAALSLDEITPYVRLYDDLERRGFPLAPVVRDVRQRLRALLEDERDNRPRGQ